MKRLKPILLRRCRPLLAVAAMVAALVGVQWAVAQESTTRVYYFKIEEEIAPPASLRVEKALEEAERQRADVVVVKLNTFGGTLDDADKIRTAFLQSSVPVWAFIDNNAASAGALIALACDSIFMHSGSSMGAATVVNQTGAVQPDKYQSYMRSMMRTTAEATGRRPDIAEAMVDPDVVVPDLSPAGKVLTFTTAEAIANGYCEAQVESLQELLRHAGVEKYTVVEQHYTWIEKLIGFLVRPVVSGLLIMLIVGGIYFELQQPGIGLPLVVAVSAAVLYFAPLYLEGLAANWEILLFLAGLLLLALELFVVPGFGVTGVAGIVCLVGGLVLSLVGNVGMDFSHVPLVSLGGSLAVVLLAVTIALPLSIWVGKRLFESRLFGGLALNEVQAAEAGYTVSQPEEASLVGCDGTAATVLRPAGKVRIEGRLYDAVAQVGFVEQGSQVTVVGYENASLVVVRKG